MTRAVSPLTAAPSTPEPAPRDEVMLSLTGKHPPALPAKLQAGRLRSEVLARERLTERLVTSDASLVLIAAPAGFGKPTLLAQWASQDPRKFAFASLDVADNDPLEMWGCIVLSIRRVQPSFGIGLEPMLNSVGGTVLDALVRYVLAELEQLDEPVVLVLDDYHAVRNLACHMSVDALLDQPLQNVHVVVSTRSDGALRLGRIRASGGLLELRGRDLAFTVEETRDLLNGTVGLALAEEDVLLLHERTEGWPAGVQLASLGVRVADDRSTFLRSFGGSNRHIVDYLTEVVLESLTDEVRIFLVETSMLRSLTGPLCDAVTGGEDSSEILDDLERNNLFLIPLDDERVGYRYHHLFAELLHQELRTRSPTRTRELHRAASRWHAGAGNVDEALAHAIAGDQPHAAGVAAGLEPDRASGGSREGAQRVAGADR